MHVLFFCHTMIKHCWEDKWAAVTPVVPRRLFVHCRVVSDTPCWQGIGAIDEPLRLGSRLFFRSNLEGCHLKFICVVGGETSIAGWTSRSPSYLPKSRVRIETVPAAPAGSEPPEAVAGDHRRRREHAVHVHHPPKCIFCTANMKDQ